MHYSVDYTTESECWNGDTLELEQEQGLSGTAIDAMFGEILRRPLLLPDEELELIQRAQQGDEEAQTRLIESNLRLVISVARRYVRPGLPLEDLVQEGAIGLIKAIRNFDVNRGLRFSTYAVHCCCLTRNWSYSSGRSKATRTPRTA